MFSVDEGIRKGFQNAIISWSRENGREFPWRKTHDPFRVLVAEILLHQTFARKVSPVYNLLTSLYPTPKELSEASETELTDQIRPLGFLYRAKTLISIANDIMGRFGGVVPGDLKGLLSLSGVGEYTAHAVLCFAYGQAVPVVDRNVIRVYKRIFSIQKPLEKINPTKRFWTAAGQLVPAGAAREYNLGLLDFAALVCKHYSPACGTCPALLVCYEPANI